jgi:hypothetical protein
MGCFAVIIVKMPTELREAQIDQSGEPALGIGQFMADKTPLTRHKLELLGIFAAWLQRDRNRRRGQLASNPIRSAVLSPGWRRRAFEGRKPSALASTFTGLSSTLPRALIVSAQWKPFPNVDTDEEVDQFLSLWG